MYTYLIIFQLWNHKSIISIQPCSCLSWNKSLCMWIRDLNLCVKRSSPPLLKVNPFKPPWDVIESTWWAGLWSILSDLVTNGHQSQVSARVFPYVCCDQLLLLNKQNKKCVRHYITRPQKGIGHVWKSCNFRKQYCPLHHPQLLVMPKMWSQGWD